MYLDQAWFLQPKVSYIGSEWVHHHQDHPFKSINPANGQTLATLYAASTSLLDQSVQAARSAMQNSEWSGLSNSARALMLTGIAKLIRDHHKELAYLESLDNGKLYKEAFNDDIPETADVFDYYAGWINKYYGETCPVGPNFLNYTLNEPVGVCGLIVPWNFPLTMASWKLAPCLAMGNTAVIKPSPATSLSLVYLLELIHQQQILPKGVLNMVLGGPEVGRALCLHPHVDKIAFTGSTAVGKEIVKNSGDSNLKYISLELGGKSPNIVFDDANNIDDIINNSFSAMFSHKGEKCSEPTRFFIHKKHYNYFVDALVHKANQVRCGGQFDEASDQGAQCTEEQLNKILRYIHIGKTEGAHLACGGERDVTGENKHGFFVRPTIFVNVNNQMKICQDEIFGPVLTVSPFEHDDEVIDMANDGIYGLAAGLFTKDITRAHKTAAHLQAGMVFINRYGCYDFSSPFGGYKQSGWGKDMAIHSLRSYTKTKSVWVAL